MKKKTHLAAGVATTLPLITVNSLICIVGIIGAVAPDWDYRLGIKHRTITHSLIALIISTGIVALFNFKVGLIWGLNYSTHLVLDSFTKMGVPLLYPFDKKCYGYKLIKTGGSEDLFICLLLIYIIAMFVK